MLIELEEQRQKIQVELDVLKSQEERNVMGQFSTPITLANEILTHAKTYLPKKGKVQFIDPALGTGAFYSALRGVFNENRLQECTGYEVDPHYGEPSRNLWKESELNVHLQDFTKASPPSVERDKYNLLICNPPYVRHHHINGEKQRLKKLTKNAIGLNISGLAGLYCYFMGLSHPWMKKDAVAGWLIPSEFMNVNYGEVLKEYLLSKVTLLQIHRFDPNDVQFDDALVSSAIVWFKNTAPTEEHEVKFTFGGSLKAPKLEKYISTQVLATEKKWTRFPESSVRSKNNSHKLGDFFKIKRGIATGNNKFFVLSIDEIEDRNLPLSQFKPILPSPRYLDETIIPSDSKGNPKIGKKLFVLDSQLPMNEIKKAHPTLYSYLQEGIGQGVTDGYICKHRNIWYAQEQRPASTFYCTYIGRSDNADKKPFRFILNDSKAIVANSYLVLYPREDIAEAIKNNTALKEKLFAALNKITGKSMLDEGRVYGGGLHKMEPRELSNVPANDIYKLLKIKKREALSEAV